MKHRVAQHHHMEETDEEYEEEEYDDDFIMGQLADEDQGYNNCCQKKLIKHFIKKKFNKSLTYIETLFICISQFMHLLILYLYIQRLTILKHWLEILPDWLDILPDIMDDVIIGLFAQMIKIMMMLHLFEELRILLKALLCKCDTMQV